MARLRDRLRILIADDHELVRHGIRSILRAHREWNVVGEAVDGAQAARMTQSLRPHILIMDVTMPNLGGLETTRQILSKAPETKILILTMHESDQMVRRILEAGARGYVLKSDPAGQLVRAVREVSQGKTFLTPKVSDIVLRGFLNVEKKGGSAANSEEMLTPRENEILRLLANGKSNKEISTVLGITVRTVETHRAKIMLKLDLHSIAGLVHYAFGKGLTDSPLSGR